MPAVAGRCGILRGDRRQISDVAVGHVAVATVVGERVVRDLVAPVAEVAGHGAGLPADRGEIEVRRAALAMLTDVGRRHLGVRVGRREDAPRLVPHDAVVDDGVVAATRDHHAGADRSGRSGTGVLRHVGVVVVVHVVVAPDLARSGAGWADAVLRRRRVVVVLRVGHDAALVVVPLTVGDDEVTTRVRPAVAERAVLGPWMVKHRVAVRARADVVGRVVHVARVGLVDAPRAFGVGHEDAVRAGRITRLPVRRRRGEVVAPVGAHADLAAAVAAVPPDLVALAEEVAGGEVLDVRAVDLVYDDAAAPARPAELLVRADGRTLRRAWLGAVDHHGGAVHAAQVQTRRGDGDAPARLAFVRLVRREVAALLVVTGPDQDPVPGMCRVDRRLDRAEGAPDAVPGPHPQDPRRRR